MMIQIQCVAALWLVSVLAVAQPADSLVPPSDNQRLIEDAVEEVGEEVDFDFNTQFESLQDYARKRLNLNTVDAATLAELGLLTPVQIGQLMRYRAQVGPLLVIEELQAVPSFDLHTIEKILPFVTVHGQRDDYTKGVREMLRGGKSMLLLRSTRTLEQQAGYRIDEGDEAPDFAGDPMQWYTRYQYQYDQHLSWGLTAEKDAGEAFGGPSNPYGFDFYSAHFYLHDLNHRIRDVAIGDFEAKLGQGLIMWSGFGFGKSSLVMNVKRGGRAIRRYTSVNEAAFLRGAGATIGLSANWELTAFTSFKRRDANVTELDTVADEALEVSSLQLSGLHRTAGEIADKGQLQEWTSGVSLRRRLGTAGHLAANAVYTQFSAPLRRTDAPYNVFRFQSDRLLNASVDYSYIWRNFNFYGETAMSDNGGLATVNGLLIGLSDAVDFSIMQRRYAPDFHAIYTNGFGETRGTSNEHGLYVGLQVQPSRRWQFSAYADTWRHPWLRFQVDAPSSGHEYLVQVTHRPRRGAQVYARFRHEVKERNAQQVDGPARGLAEQGRTQARLHFQYPITKGVEWRSRVELSRFALEERREWGWLVYQDLNLKPTDFPVDVTTRWALFDTDGFDTRIYAYESDLLYSFSIPPYQYNGSRFYVNVSYRPIKPLLLQVRYARTRYFDRDIVGSGPLAIDGPARSDMRLLLRWRW